MAKQTILKKEFGLKNGVMVINETVEKELSKEELLREYQNYEQQQQQFKMQSACIKAKYEEIEAAKLELKTMIDSFGSDEIVTI